MSFRTSDFDFELPPEQIAQQPSPRREESRLLVVDRGTGEIHHRIFRDLVELIRPGDAVVVNESRVFPARLRGTRGGGGAAEVLLLHPLGDEGSWEALVRPGGKLKPGRVIQIGPELAVEISEVLESGNRRVKLRSSLPVAAAIERYGEVPLPPYVERAPTEADRERYQTVYARTPGSVAAPTAGLHFTEDVLRGIEARGARIARILLHVGVGTFRPVDTDDPAEHRMHSEWFDVPEEAASVIRDARTRGGAVWAVGTTSVRTLESVASAEGIIPAGQGWTDIFIRPPYRFRAVDRLITNFHLPRSTLLMLVSAFAGHELTMRAYEEAIREGYRFFSYGDAMAVV